MGRSPTVAATLLLVVTSVSAKADVLTVQGTLIGQSVILFRNTIQAHVNNYTFAPANVPGTITSAVETVQATATPSLVITGANATTMIKGYANVYFGSLSQSNGLVNGTGSMTYGMLESFNYDQTAGKLVASPQSFSFYSPVPITATSAGQLRTGYVSDLNYSTALIVYISGPGLIPPNLAGIQDPDMPFTANLAVAITYIPYDIPEPIPLATLGGDLLGLAALRKRC